MPHRLRSLAAAALAAAFLASCGGKPADLPDGLYARVDTNRGSMFIYLEHELAPLAAANFLGLAEGLLDATMGKPFYDGLKFHRYEEGFVLQGGDPAGDGSGGPGYVFPDEFHPRLRHDAIGVIGMANYAPNTNGSQFYLTLDATPNLDDRYATFGRVVRGLDVLKKLRAGDRIEKIRMLKVGGAVAAYRPDQARWQAALESATQAAIERMRAQKEIAAQQIQARWPGLERRDDGFMVKVLEEGSGPTIRRFWLAKVSYKGMLPNGQVFDDSSLRGQPIEFEVGSAQVIPGWDKMVMEMKKGERRLVAIPPEFAYGPDGAAGGRIPPNSYLIFEMKIEDYTE